MNNKKKKILFCNNIWWDLMNFRGYVINSLANDGYDVTIVAPREDENSSLKIPVPDNVRFVPVDLDRCGTNPVNDLRYFLQLLKIYKKVKPDYIFHFTIKPNIYGTFAAKMLGIPCTNMLAGLGYTLVDKGLMNRIVRLMYKFAVSLADHVFVLNRNNYEFVLADGFSTPEKIILLECGEGIDLEKYSFSENFSKDTTFLMVARILKDKGYHEFVEAAKIVKSKCPKASFKLLGPLDNSSPTHVTKEELDEDVAKGYIEYLGVTNDVKKIVCKPGTVIVLPSYHEGLSRSLMEACAMGRPIITTEIPGCKETVRQGINGFLVEPQNAKALAKAMLDYIALSDEEKANFSRESRKLAEEQFDVNDVVEAYRNVLREHNL